jgi:hypothetical protein
MSKTRPKPASNQNAIRAMEPTKSVKEKNQNASLHLKNCGYSWLASTCCGFVKYNIPKIFYLGQPMSNPLCQNVAQRKVQYDKRDRQSTGTRFQLRFNHVRTQYGVRGASPAPAGGSPKCATSWSARWMEAAGEPRPEQIWIPGANREVKFRPLDQALALSAANTLKRELQHEPQPKSE